MSINAAAVKELRDKTNIGFMDCKEALLQTNGDIEKAVIYLRKKGLMKADAKAGRPTKEGRIEIFFDEAKVTAYILEVNCETDFVAKNEKFITLVQSLVTHIREESPEDIDELMTQKFKAEPGETVADYFKASIAMIGENMSIRRLLKVKRSDAHSLFQHYIHAGSKLGVLVEALPQSAGDLNHGHALIVLKDIAMHIAASAPKVVCPSEVPLSLLETEKQIYTSQVDPKKPEQIRQKIIDGKISKYVDEISLTKQPFVKNPDITVSDYLEQEKKNLSTSLTIKKFIRCQLGD